MLRKAIALIIVLFRSVSTERSLPLFCASLFPFPGMVAKSRLDKCKQSWSRCNRRYQIWVTLKSGCNKTNIFDMGNESEVGIKSSLSRGANFKYFKRLLWLLQLSRELSLQSNSEPGLWGSWWKGRLGGSKQWEVKRNSCEKVGGLIVITVLYGG